MTDVKLFDKNGLEIDHLTQWDYNVILQIHDFEYDVAPICHFAKKLDKKALSVASTLSNGVVSVSVPNILLTDNKDYIKMFVFLTDLDGNTGRTIYKVILPVEEKPKPDDYEYSDNVEVIELNVLRAKLESLIEQTEETLTDRIDELENTYKATIVEIKDSIQDDVDNLNKQITNSNAALIKEIKDSNAQLTSNIETTTDNLNAEIQTALDTLIRGIRDGSPKGVFSNVDELAEKDVGIYLYVNPQSDDNGYIYYWDGENLSNKLLYYAGIVVNDGEITYNKFADNLKRKIGIIVYCTLQADKWKNQTQEIEISSDVYNVTDKTNAIIHLDSDTYDLLSECDCESLCVSNNTNGDKLIAQIEGNIPDKDFTIQLILVDN